MPVFVPPTVDSGAWGDPDAEDPANRLFSFYSGLQEGVTVFQDQDGNWHQQQYPYWGNKHRSWYDGKIISESTSTGLQHARRFFLGGHIHQIDQETASELTEAGFGDRINIVSPVEITPTNAELDLLSNQVMTAHSPNTPDRPGIDGNITTFNLQSGTQNFSNRRDFWLHDHTSGWRDTRVFCRALAPLVFTASHPDLGQVLPQGGAVLRFQPGGTAKKGRGVTINNNIFLGLHMLNIGVWEAYPDGTGFANRQTSFDFFENPGFPYGFEAILEGSTVQVRVFPSSQYQTPPPWDHPTLARTINLDTDAGNADTIPTPIGQGTNGFISAHPGTHPLAAVRIGPTTFERLD